MLQESIVYYLEREEDDLTTKIANDDLLFADHSLPIDTIHITLPCAFFRSLTRWYALSMDDACELCGCGWAAFDGAMTQCLAATLSSRHFPFRVLFAQSSSRHLKIARPERFDPALPPSCLSSHRPKTVRYDNPKARA